MNKLKILKISLFCIFFTISCIFLIQKVNKNYEQQDKPNTIEIITNSQTLTLQVELAKTPKEITTGLMNRTELCLNCGMLFVFKDDQIRKFWMKNTLIPLDILFIDKDGKVVNIAKTTKPDQTQEQYSSTHPVRYVLEVNGGWCELNGVESGNKINLNDIIT